MIGLTLCSGIGAPEVAAPWIDWVFASEIEAFPRAVLEQRLGYRTDATPRLWGDMADVSADLLANLGVPLPDLIVAGTPCQSFSVSGLRRGLHDERGNLTLKFVEICNDIANARAAGHGLTVLWENVPGVLTDKTNAFGALLGGFVGADTALDPPDGRRWPRAGMVAGPLARAAWRVLDAKHFGVPQRRRRVFLVVDFGNRVDPAEILFEREGVCGDTVARGAAGEKPAPAAGSGATGGRRAVPFDRQRIGVYGDGSVGSTLAARDYKDAADLVAFDCRAGGKTGLSIGACAGALRGEGHGGGHAAIAFDRNQITSPQNGSVPTPDLLHTLPADPSPPVLARPVVRRLTPTECARLQGFPDGFCEIEWRGKPPEACPVGHQYKAYGNSMAVPVVRWIIERIAESRATPERKPK